MALDIEYYNLGSFSDINVLRNGLESAFCRAFGWTVAEDGRCYDGNDRSVGVLFETSGAAVRYTLTTNGAGGTSSGSPLSVSYNLTYQHFFNFIRSPDGKTFAFGASAQTPSNTLTAVIADDTAGNKAFAASNNYFCSNGYIMSTSVMYSANVFVGDHLCTSIVKMPNCYTGAMMKNLYRIVSAPVAAASLGLLLIDGRYYRPAGNNGLWAIPVT